MKKLRLGHGKDDTDVTKPRNEERDSAQPNAVVVLSGGAPNSPLSAGALCAIYEKGKTFTTFYTSGAGATIGMLFLAPPSGTTTPQALKGVLNSSIDDRIWNWLPLPYKTFFKSGPFAVPFEELAQSLHLPEEHHPHHTSGHRRHPAFHHFRRFYNDWIDLWAATICPTDLNFFSQGLCCPFPFITEAVDFNKLKQFAGNFYMNAYSITDGEMQNFEKKEIGPQHFDAAMAFPFVYPPAQIGNKYYYEGSAHDPLNLPKLVHVLQAIGDQPDIIVLVDLLGAFQKSLVRTPRNILDAFGISIMMPVVSLAEKDQELYECSEHPGFPDLTPLTFNVPDKLAPHMADWSHSNMQELFCIGYKAGEQFLEKYGDLLPDRVPEGPDPA
jgi:NTE family protein